jgi:hypothetical protein
LDTERETRVVIAGRVLVDETQMTVKILLSKDGLTGRDLTYDGD